MKKILVVICFLIAHTANAQNRENQVKAIVQRLFTAMKSGDAGLLKSCFTDSAILQTIAVNRQTGAVSIKQTPVSDFIGQVKRLPKDSADERIMFDVVKLDANLASVWTPYRFYYGGRFSHCGVHSFQLVKVAGVWKIQSLIDTRRKEDCE